VALLHYRRVGLLALARFEEAAIVLCAEFHLHFLLFFGAFWDEADLEIKKIKVASSNESAYSV
jgi:hypothetical protein